jgi:transposase
VNPKKLIENADASASAKRQLEVIFEVLGGKRSVPEACEELAVSESTFHRMREQVIHGALEGLAPKPMGRPSKAAEGPSDRERELERANRELRMELQAMRVRTEIALVAPHLLTSQKKSAKKARSQELFGPNTGTKPE